MIWRLILSCGSSVSETPAVVEADPPVLPEEEEVSPCSGGSGLAPGEQSYLMIGELSVWVFVPQEVIPCAPMFIYGHGGGSAGGTLEDGFWADQSTELPQRSHEFGFVLVVPGLSPGAASTHFWSSEEIPEYDQAIRDVADLVDVDLGQVLFAGNSAGGVMAGYYGLYAPTMITHVGVSAAGFGGQYTYPPNEPDPKLPFFVAHDPQDPQAPYALSEAFVAELVEHGHQVSFTDSHGGHFWTSELTDKLLEWWL